MRSPSGGRSRVAVRWMPDRRGSAELASALLLARAPGLGPTRLGVVDGPSGSGKTTFAGLWERDLRSRGVPVTVFSSDLLATWTDPFGWFDRFDSQVLGPISRGDPGRIRLTDWTGDDATPGRWLVVPVTDVLILEGVSAARSGIAGRATVAVWVEIENRAERLERAVARDGESSRSFLTAWQDAEDAFFAADHTRARADLLVGAADAAGIDGGGPMNPSGETADDGPVPNGGRR